MWILRVQIDGEFSGLDLTGFPLIYTGSDTACRVLFGVLKERFPGAMYALESLSDGSLTIPHKGEGFPYWFRAEGLTHKYHTMRFLTQSQIDRLCYEIQKRNEPPTEGHSSEVEEPPEDVQLIDDEEEIAI